MAINKSDFIKKRPRKTQIVASAGLGGDVIISVLSAAEKEAFENWVSSNGDVKSGHIRAKLVSLSVLDDSGARMFTDDDLGSIGDQPADAIMELFDAILALNAFTKKDSDALLKNSEPTHVADSTSN